MNTIPNRKYLTEQEFLQLPKGSTIWVPLNSTPAYIKVDSVKYLMDPIILGNLLFKYKNQFNVFLGGELIMITKMNND